MQPTIDFHALAPELILSATILLVIIVDVFLKPKHKPAAMWISLVGVSAALVATLTLIGEHRSLFGGAFVVDSFAVLFQTFFLVVALVVLLLSLRYFRDGTWFQGEYYALLLSSFLGCLFMVASRDLLMLFISIELVSAPGFLMAAFRKRDVRSNEAGLKFFIIGVLSSAVMLYGMSMIYGLTGTTNLEGISVALGGTLGDNLPMILASILFIVAGFAFKVSAVPFQFWAPDTYEGSPVPVAAFLSTASKAAGFAGLLQLMFVAFIHQAHFWTPIFAALAVATMAIGNLVALQQRQAVRLLAYSSIAQAGYMLLPFALAVPVAAGSGVNAEAFSATVLYILIYSVMNLGAFAVVTALSQDSPRLLISDFSGLIKRAPGMAIAMTLFLLSLAGIPPTAGFWAKFFVFRAAIDRGGPGPWLAGIMVVFSVVSLFYYLAIVKQMITGEAEVGLQHRLAAPKLVGAVVAVAAFFVVAIGLYPDLFAKWPPLSTLVGQ